MNDGSEGGEEKKFRFSAIQVGLTYSRASEYGINKPGLLAALRSIDDCICDYAISEEDHKDGTQHYHVYLRYAYKRNIRDPRHWDVLGSHPHVRRISSVIGWLTYLRKDDPDPLESPGLPGRPAAYLHYCDSGDLPGALKSFAEKYPKEFVIHLPRIRENLRTLSTPSQEEKYYDLDSFPQGEQVCASWVPGTTLVLSGPTGTGKTEFAYSLGMERARDGVCLVRHRDALKSFTPGQFLLFDDWHFDGWIREEVIHLLDCGRESQINVKHSMCRIPAGTLRVITTNRDFDSLFPYLGIDAIKRRVSWVEIPLSLFE